MSSIVARTLLASLLVTLCRFSNADCLNGTSSNPIDGLGIGVHFKAGASEQLRSIKKLGFRIVRVDLTWNTIEKVKGQYDWTEYDKFLAEIDDNSLRPLLVLGYSNAAYSAFDASAGTVASPATEQARLAFGRWAFEAAQRYGHLNPIWEIWNEPNHPRFWLPKPSSDDYVKLADHTISQIRRAHSRATIIGPALAGIDSVFLRYSLQLVSLDFDYLSLHPYRAADQVPESLLSDINKLISSFTKSELVSFRVRERLAYSEWGFSTYTKGASFKTQADYVERTMLLNIMEAIPINIMYTWRDGINPELKESNFGIVSHDLKMKESYFGIETLVSELDNRGTLCPITNLQPGLFGFWFHPIGSPTKLVLWNSIDAKVAHFFLDQNCRVIRIRRRNTEDIELPCNSNGSHILIDSTPTYITIEV
jgi:hypothetical protein